MKNQPKPFNIEEIKQLDKEQLIALVVDLFKRYNFAEEKLKAMMMRTFARKSEVNDKQFNLFSEEEFSELASFIESTHSCNSSEATPDTSDDALAQAESSTPPKKPRGRKVINPDLPREERVIDLEDKTCKTCSSEMTAMGEAISEKVDFIPAKIVVIRTKRIKYTCSCCQTLVAAPMPAEIIDKGIPTENLLAEVVAKKFIYHLPLYRQQQLFKTMGVDFSLSTLSDWVAAVGNALAPLAERLKTLLLEQQVIHADETRLNILDNRRGNSIIHGYIWAYASSIHSNVPIIYYDCTDSREGKHAQNILKTFKGKLVVDDYSGYKALFDTYKSIIEVGCFTHVRRKFAEIVKVAPHPFAQYFINESAKLYQIEDELKHLTPKQRKRGRKKFAKPILKKLKKWLIECLSKTLPNTLFARALNHAINRWKSLEIYLHDGNVPIDNNHIERNIRPIALGRKNWLFAGSLEAGQLMTNIMSLLATARANGIDPEQWLRKALAVLPTWKYSELDKLLPLKSIQETEDKTNSASTTSTILDNN